MNKLFPPFDLERVKRLAGPNDDFPGRPTYAYGSESRINHTWLKAARSYLEAFEPNWVFKFKAGVVYLVGPSVLQLIQAEVGNAKPLGSLEDPNERDVNFMIGQVAQAVVIQLGPLVMGEHLADIEQQVRARLGVSE